MGLKSGILFFKYKDHIRIGLKQAVEVVNTRLKLQEGIAYPILCDISGVREVDKDARNYLATEGSLFSKAIAFITDKPVSAQISKMFITNYTPPIPIRICQNKEEALDFLNAFK